MTEEFDEPELREPPRQPVEVAATQILDSARPSAAGTPPASGHVDGTHAAPGVGAGVPPIDTTSDVDTAIDPEPVGGRRTSGARVFIDWIVVIAIALLVAFLVRGFVLAHFVVDGSSMSPTLESGDRVFVNKLSYRLHDPNRGDVVVLHQISGASERDLIKRVIAVDGEEIEMRSCQVFVDGAALDEPYLAPATLNGNCGGDFAPVLVPSDSVFVMGDNRGGSQDSRQLGPIDDSDLIGRAFVVFWPVGHWQWL
ncbi:MAG: signal peptidase I [Acidimicrobiia bacterium]|nr:signal peptidase I [Acidimicrobiia bacterium]